MAQMGAAESLTSTLRQQTESLFGTTPADVQRELAKLATPKNFSLLARDFFSRLSERYLTYFLSRELSNHRSVDENRQFREALSLHCKQASKIVEQFAGGWYSKTNFEGGITQRKAANFIQVALKTAAKRSCAVLALSRRREDRASRPCNAIQSRGRAPTRVTAGACDLPHGFRPKPAGGSYCISSG
jgi:hypothetical protein